MSCPRVTPQAVSRTHEHLLHSYVGPYNTPILVRMSRSEVPRLIINQRHEMCFYAFIDCHLQWPTAVVMLPVLSLSDSKYTRVPLAHARPFITCHVNNTVLCIILSRSNNEWTCIYARGIGTISGHSSNP